MPERFLNPPDRPDFFSGFLAADQHDPGRERQREHQRKRDLPQKPDALLAFVRATFELGPLGGAHRQRIGRDEIAHRSASPILPDFWVFSQRISAPRSSLTYAAAVIAASSGP